MGAMTLDYAAVTLVSLNHFFDKFVASLFMFWPISQVNTSIILSWTIYIIFPYYTSLRSPHGTVNNLNISHIKLNQDLIYYQQHNKREKINTDIGKLITHQRGRIKGKDNSNNTAQRNPHYSQFQPEYSNDHPKFNPDQFHYILIMGYPHNI